MKQYSEGRWRFQFRAKSRLRKTAENSRKQILCWARRDLLWVNRLLVIGEGDALRGRRCSITATAQTLVANVAVCCPRLHVQRARSTGSSDRRKPVPPALESAAAFPLLVTTDVISKPIGVCGGVGPSLGSAEPHQEKETPGFQRAGVRPFGRASQRCLLQLVSDRARNTMLFGTSSEPLRRLSRPARRGHRIQAILD